MKILIKHEIPNKIKKIQNHLKIKSNLKILHNKKHHISLQINQIQKLTKSIKDQIDSSVNKQCVANYSFKTVSCHLINGSNHDFNKRSIIVGGEGGRKQFGFNTDYKTAKVQIQTVIVNGNKESFGCQIDERIMARQLNVQKKPKVSQKSQSNVQTQDNTQNQQAQQKQKTQKQQNQQQLSQQTIKKLDRFIRKVTPLMDKELNENLPLYTNFGVGEQKQFFKKQTRLSYTLQNLDSLQQQGLVVSDVSWNSTNVMVAAGYCKKQHTSTCSHKSMICLWSLFKRTFNPNKPEVIYTNNCINCIAFHPKRPSVFAVGNYIGEILLYDLTKKEQFIGKTLVDDYYHRDVISQINWWPFKPPGKSQVSHNLLSLSTDGKILLWEVPNTIFGEDTVMTNNLKLKNLLKNPIKGFSILRKKEGVVIPVSALSMSQSKSNKNVFIIGSEGGSILKANLTNISHYMNTQGKILLDMQQQIKFKKEVYPFLLNVPQKQFRQLKEFIQKSAKSNNLNIISTVDEIYQQKPKLTLLYPNAITFAYEPLSYPISDISFNRYGLFIANGCDGYSRLYMQNRKQHLQSFEEGYQWAWINEGTKIGGFMGQQFVVIDWLKGNTIWSVPVGEGLRWKQSMGNSIAVICQETKIKIIQLGDKVLRQDEGFTELFSQRMGQLTEGSA